VSVLDFCVGVAVGMVGGSILTVCWLGYGLYRLLTSYYDEAQKQDKDIEPIIHGDGQMWVDRPARNQSH
jgi:hypothetical protein